MKFERMSRRGVLERVNDEGDLGPPYWQIYIHPNGLRNLRRPLVSSKSNPIIHPIVHDSPHLKPWAWHVSSVTIGFRVRVCPYARPTPRVACVGSRELLLIGVFQL